MKDKSKILIGVIFFNEQDKFTSLLENFKKLNISYPHQIIFLNDGSTDKSEEVIANFLQKNPKIKAKILTNHKNMGVGFSIRKVIQYGLGNGFEIVVIMAGNGKDNPLEIPKLIEPIIKKNYDYVQGSRFLSGGASDNLPFLRKTLIQGFTSLINLFTLSQLTDSSNGFRAYKLSIFNDRRIDLNQKWLNRYELETYLQVKILTLGFKIKEVAVTKNYLVNVWNYSKIKPILDWWRILKPLFLLKLGIKK